MYFFCYYRNYNFRRLRQKFTHWHLSFRILKQLEALSQKQKKNKKRYVIICISKRGGLFLSGSVEWLKSVEVAICYNLNLQSDHPKLLKTKRYESYN